ncbi:carboxypeptidase regulatory-like domain-containing protein [Candidatus Poribacteria bacterium]|jgi:hypothetical protein|nr:carboxypeptidase regulatory-like domain-containing protein [Candidatus Poribacteria bacterium]MBT5533332.1 carboxypeptidase regulatory-like domain-containing protein [Candidatus Poribacteria bacterium]MBT5712431.1 carboxypeptidase regulatory-like domain-containing protein [Candidatus Poribacteria bacterium]MBT7096916.1 carboxypeptidase regulatory-like domain-containing protein [Candidatus Poribacteria bacterium]MBT7807328.1 carboxypeptidase regulatory-like domain-containing protein [Candidat
MASCTARSRSDVPRAWLLAALVATATLWASPESARSQLQGTPTTFTARVLADGSVHVPLGGATVRYELDSPEAAPVDGTVRTEPNGRCEVTGIPQGVYALEVEAVGYTTRTDASVVVVEGATTHVDLVLQPEPARVKSVRFAALVGGGLILVLTIMRGRVRSRRQRSE